MIEIDLPKSSPNGCAFIFWGAILFWIIIGFTIKQIYDWATAPELQCYYLEDGTAFKRDERGHSIPCEESKDE